MRELTTKEEADRIVKNTDGRTHWNVPPGRDESAVEALEECASHREAEAGLSLFYCHAVVSYLGTVVQHTVVNLPVAKLGVMPYGHHYAHARVGGTECERRAAAAILSKYGFGDETEIYADLADESSTAVFVFDRDERTGMTVVCDGDGRLIAEFNS